MIVSTKQQLSYLELILGIRLMDNCIVQLTHQRWNKLNLRLRSLHDGSRCYIAWDLRPPSLSARWHCHRLITFLKIYRGKVSRVEEHRISVLIRTHLFRKLPQ